MNIRKSVTAWRESGSRKFGIVVDGLDGDGGWSPVFSGENDGARTVIKVADWTGGGGVKPPSGQYIGPSSFVTNKADAFNFNYTKRMDVFSGVTNASGVATIDYSTMGLTSVPKIICLPATTSTLSGPTRSSASSITSTGCSVTVQQQALLTGLLSVLTGATANVLVIEQ